MLSNTWILLLSGNLYMWHALFSHVVCISAPGINWFHEKKLIHEKALELVKYLCNLIEPLDYRQAQTICKDTIIAAAESGNNDVVEEIVRTLPFAIHTRNYLNQNFLHVAVKNRCEKGFNLIYRTSNYRINYSEVIDNSGNSILHLAARLAPPNKLNLVSGAALQMQRELQWFQVYSYL